MQTFSALSLLRRAFGGHQSWQPHWRAPEPRAEYDAVIVGGGGHGLGTAYYLASEHGMRNVAVLERGWLGGGNTGRNTTILRSNYLFDESAALYDHSLKLWAGLSRALNYNIMYSPRGVLMLAHNPGLHDLALLLTGPQAMAQGAPAARALAEGYPTGTLAEFSVAGPWRTLDEGGAQLLRFLRPRDLVGVAD